MAKINDDGIVEGDTYFCEKVAATKLGVSVRKLQADRQAGRGLRFFRFGRCIRYSLYWTNWYILMQMVDPQGPDKILT